MANIGDKSVVLEITPMSSILTEKKEGELQLDVDNLKGKIEVSLNGKKVADDLKSTAKIAVTDPKVELTFNLLDKDDKPLG
jgi:hypothetical protein